FTRRLAALAAGQGVTFLQGVTVRRLGAEGDRITAVETDAGTLKADAVVVAMGSWSPILLRPLGIHIPVYPVKGYSITVPVTDPDAAPVSTVMDESYKIAITRLGDRIRAGGRAELCGYDRTLRPQRRAALDHSVADLFPRGGDLSRASFWTGLRPMTPDGTPVIGPTPYANLWLNTGHGTLGWTMACGSGRVLADQMSGRTPDIETADLSLRRYR
ncbi:MAG: FAD-dependent oxidoreductase, partial [Lysobacteraceae bacterium]